MILLNDNLLEIMQVYQRTQSLEKTAEEMQISTGKVRRALLTLGLWKNQTSEQIKVIRSEHPNWENSRIAKELNISLKTVQMYTPYGVGADKVPHGAEYAQNARDSRADQPILVGKQFHQTTPKATGQCGDTVWWRLFEDERLEIVGTGEMWNNFDCSEVRFHTRSILIGDEVTSIGTGAFSYCSFLREVVFGRGVQIIGPRAFYHCDNLNRITIPDDTLDTWGKVDIFEGDPIITVHVPATVKQIPMEILDIPSLMQFVCEQSEEECKEGYFSREGILYYRNGNVQEIVKCPCSKPLYSYKVMDGTTKVCPDCFNTFKQRQTLEEVELPESITDIGYSAFFDNKRLKSIVIPDKVKSIGQAAFYGCEDLERVEFGTELEVIGITAFRLCRALTELTIPENVTVVGDEAFAKCEGISRATFLGDAPKVKDHDYYHEGIFGRRVDDFKIRYVEGKKGWTDPWKGYRTKIVETNLYPED